MSASVVSTPASIETLTRMLERERAARKRAEQLMIDKCRELFLSNSEIQRTAQALEIEVQRSRAVFDTAAEGIIIFDSNGRIESLNSAAEEIFCLKEHHTITNICELLPESAFCVDNGGCIVHGLRAILGESNETTGLKADGERIPLEIVVSEFQANGQTSFSGIVRDLTRRKLLESKLAQAQKLESVGQLAAGIAHELNTPIQFVDNNTRFLREAFESIQQLIQLYQQLIAACDAQSSHAAHLQLIQQACEQVDLCFLLEEIPLAIDQTLQGTNNVARIVKAMKGFSHPGTSSFQEIDLNSALESTLIVCRNEWKYCADLRADYCPDLPAVKCLPGELNQVFLNLIVNATHAIQDKLQATGDDKGTLTIKTGFDERVVFVQIGDSGTGIPEAIRMKVFDPFFTTKGVGKGTGQGLSISYGIIVDLHQGSISFESVEGEGTTFRVEIPRVRQE